MPVLGVSIVGIGNIRKGNMRKQNKYKQPLWAVGLIYRENGVIEDVCKHGVGHPNQEWLDKVGFEHINGIHGCDGCCSKEEHESNQTTT